MSRIQSNAARESLPRSQHSFTGEEMERRDMKMKMKMKMKMNMNMNIEMSTIINIKIKR